MKKVLFLSVITGLLFLSSSTASAQSVDLLWQGETYTPPFYKGKALWTRQSEITFMAIPQGLGNPSSLRYMWSRNGTVLGSVSGVGRNSLSFYDTVLSKPLRIVVEIVNDNDEILASNSISIAPTNSSIVIYEKNPLYGYMFHKEVGRTFTLNKKEVTFSVFPMFAGTQSRYSGDNVYEWRADGGERRGVPDSTYRTPDDESGESTIRVTHSNPYKILPALNRTLLVQFGND